MATDAQKSQAYAAKAAVADAESSMAAEAQSSRADQGRSNVVGAASGTLASTADTSRMKPANWLSKIRVLRDAGHHDQAKASLIEFQHMHPDYVIPSDLAPLLRE